MWTRKIPVLFFLSRSVPPKTRLPPSPSCSKYAFPTCFHSLALRTVRTCDSTRSVCSLPTEPGFRPVQFDRGCEERKGKDSAFQSPERRRSLLLWSPVLKLQATRHSGPLQLLFRDSPAQRDRSELGGVSADHHLLWDSLRPDAKTGERLRPTATGLSRHRIPAIVACCCSTGSELLQSLLLFLLLPLLCLLLEVAEPDAPASELLLSALHQPGLSNTEPSRIPHSLSLLYSRILTAPATLRSTPTAPILKVFPTKLLQRSLTTSSRLIARTALTVLYRLTHARWMTSTCLARLTSHTSPSLPSPPSPKQWCPLLRRTPWMSTSVKGALCLGTAGSDAPVPCITFLMEMSLRRSTAERIESPSVLWRPTSSLELPTAALRQLRRIMVFNLHTTLSPAQTSPLCLPRSPLLVRIKSTTWVTMVELNWTTWSMTRRHSLFLSIAATFQRSPILLPSSPLDEMVRETRTPSWAIPFPSLWRISARCLLKVYMTIEGLLPPTKHKTIRSPITRPTPSHILTSPSMPRSLRALHSLATTKVLWMGDSIGTTLAVHMWIVNAATPIRMSLVFVVLPSPLEWSRAVDDTPLSSLLHNPSATTITKLTIHKPPRSPLIAFRKWCQVRMTEGIPFLTSSLRIFLRTDPMMDQASTMRMCCRVSRPLLQRQNIQALYSRRNTIHCLLFLFIERTLRRDQSCRALRVLHKESLQLIHQILAILLRWYSNNPLFLDVHIPCSFPTKILLLKVVSSLLIVEDVLLICIFLYYLRLLCWSSLRSLFCYYDVLFIICGAQFAIYFFYISEWTIHSFISSCSTCLLHSWLLFVSYALFISMHPLLLWYYASFYLISITFIWHHRCFVVLVENESFTKRDGVDSFIPHHELYLYFGNMNEKESITHLIILGFYTSLHYIIPITIVSSILLVHQCPWLVILLMINWILCSYPNVVCVPMSSEWLQEWPFFRRVCYHVFKNAIPIEVHGKENLERMIREKKRYITFVHVLNTLESSMF